MNIKDLANISLEDIYWQLKFGKSKNKINVFDLRSELNKYIKNPVFFLSTGRCGTKWFSDLLKNDKSLMVLHSPKPSFAIQSKLVYEVIDNKVLSDTNKNLIMEIFLVGREQLLRYSHKTNKRFVETNNYITFFAPLLIDLFPDAKFIHLYRHPGEFVRSGIRRDYYSSDNSDAMKRIVPTDVYEKEKWKKYSQLEKTSWLWNETNVFIEKFKDKYPKNCFDFNFNNLSENNVNELLKFLEIDINKNTVVKSLKNKKNIQKKGDFPKYENWEKSQQESLINICKKLSDKYYYSL